MKRVLIITYYWPPSGGSGVQRWLKMSKYLPENGWQPVIYTAENAEYPVEDASLAQDVAAEAEILKRRIVEPYTFYKQFLGMKKEEKVKAGFINESAKKSSWKEKLSVWLRGNLFVPDARRWWIKPSVKYLTQYLKKHSVDAIVSTGPPHSMHLIAMALHKKFNIPWVADFRDPWTNIDFYKDLKLTRCADRKHHRLERQVLAEATKVVTVGWHCAEDLENHGAKDVAIVTNGYDVDNHGPRIEANPPLHANNNSPFVLSHIGIIGANRNPESFWQAINELTQTIDLKIRLIGQVDNSVLASIKYYNIERFVEIIPYIPHNQVIEEQQKSDVLLLFVNNSQNAKGILTGKIFEYMVSGRPILSIGPEDGDSARVLNETQTGVTVDFNDKERMKTVILDFFAKHQENQLIVNNRELVEKYSRRNLTKDFVKILNGII